MDITLMLYSDGEMNQYSLTVNEEQIQGMRAAYHFYYQLIGDNESMSLTYSVPHTAGTETEFGLGKINCRKIEVNDFPEFSDDDEIFPKDLARLTEEERLTAPPSKRYLMVISPQADEADEDIYIHFDTLDFLNGYMLLIEIIDNSNVSFLETPVQKETRLIAQRKEAIRSYRLFDTGPRATI